MKRFALVLASLLIATPAVADDVRDASYDFDFVLGTFHTHIKRLMSPLSGANDWVEYNGTKYDVPILGGGGSVETIEADGPEHLEFLTIRLYNAQSHEWSLNFSSSDSGEMATPSTGSFKDGIGTFIDKEDYKRRTILVRQLWTQTAPGAYHFEQAFSADFGKTWEANFIADLNKLKS